MFTESNFIVKFWPTSGVVGGVKQTICLWEIHLIFMKILSHHNYVHWCYYLCPISLSFNSISVCLTAFYSSHFSLAFVGEIRRYVISNDGGQFCT